MRTYGKMMSDYEDMRDRNYWNQRLKRAIRNNAVEEVEELLDEGRTYQYPIEGELPPIQDGTIEDLIDTYKYR